jgi:hypothetical protein
MPRVIHLANLSTGDARFISVSLTDRQRHSSIGRFNLCLLLISWYAFATGSSLQIIGLVADTGAFAIVRFVVAARDMAVAIGMLLAWHSWLM